MGFLTPWFLAGVAAVGIPLYLHLLRRHQTTPQPFSSLMFFEARTQSSVKHRRLRYLLLLSLRLALILLLVLTFANPYIHRSAASVTGDRLLLLVIDDSFSMRAGTRLADARQQALSVLNSKPAAEPAEVMTMGYRLQSRTQPTENLAALRSAINAIGPGDSHANFGELSRAIRSMAETVHTPIELHLFSDMQKSKMPGTFSELALPANATLTLHPVVSSAAPNWTVENVNAPGQVWDPKKARVQALIAGYGTPAATRGVSLVVNGKTIATQNVAMVHSLNGRATVEFQSLEVPHGFSRCEVRIDSADTFADDDASLSSRRAATHGSRKCPFHARSERFRSPVYFKAAVSIRRGRCRVRIANGHGGALLEPRFLEVCVRGSVRPGFDALLSRKRPREICSRRGQRSDCRGHSGGSPFPGCRVRRQYFGIARLCPRWRPVRCGG